MNSNSQAGKYGQSDSPVFRNADKAPVTVTLGDALLASGAVYAYQEITPKKLNEKNYDQIVDSWRDEVVLISLQENKQSLGEKLIKMEFARVGKGYVNRSVDKIDTKLVDPNQPVTIDMYGNSSISYLDDSMMPDMSPRNAVFAVVFVKFAASAVDMNDIREAIASDKSRKQREFIARYGIPDENIEQMMRDYKEAFCE